MTRWSLADPKPLVLLVDEIDSLVGDTLLSVLRQLRVGYEQRPEGFPQSVVLCGVRDVQDHRIRSSSGEMIAGGSPFNVAARSLRLGDFTEAETRALLAQHTAETGQAFAPEALQMVRTQTQGQPWLVNALCADACFDNESGRDRSRAIAAADVLDARERLIPSRRTRLDQLAHKLEFVEMVRERGHPDRSGPTLRGRRPVNRRCGRDPRGGRGESPAIVGARPPRSSNAPAPDRTTPNVRTGRRCPCRRSRGCTRTPRTGRG